MTESERLQKIVETQEKELRRLRKLMSVVRVAQVEYEVEGSVLRIIGTCIGVDEYLFLEKLKPELERVAEVIIGHRAAIEIDVTQAKDTVSGEPLTGAVSPQP